MKLFFHKTKGQLIEYNIRLINKILADYLVSSPIDADYVILSLCDISELPELIKAKVYNKPIIIGGMISEYPIVNELADYVWHGEIYAFRDMLNNDMTLDDMPHITSRKRKTLNINQDIRWSENPIIKVGNRAMYYYVSKGCPIRCKYCYISNVRDYQVIPEDMYKNALRQAGDRLMPIAAYNPYGTSIKTNIGETLLKRYISGKMAMGAKTLRSGVEFVNPVISKELAKGVTIDDVNQAIIRSKADKTKLILYYIAGLETQEELEEYFNNLIPDYAINYPVTIVFTYIDPQPFTPMHDFNLNNKITNINHKKLYWIAGQRNKRIRFMPLAGPEKSLLRTMYSRAISIDDYNWIKSISKLSHAEILNKCNRPHLMGKADLSDIIARRRETVVPAYWRET